VNRQEKPQGAQITAQVVGSPVGVLPGIIAIGAFL
jgi:hypothetical protein